MAESGESGNGESRVRLVMGRVGVGRVSEIGYVGPLESQPCLESDGNRGHRTERAPLPLKSGRDLGSTYVYDGKIESCM